MEKVREDIELDFTGLFTESLQEKSDPVSPVEPQNASTEYKTISDQKKPVEGHLNAREDTYPKPPHKSPARRPYRQAQRGLEYNERTLEIYKHYQANILKSEQLQSDILKGVRAGEDIYKLFLKAVKAISLMTSDNVIYKQIEADIKQIYGIGLSEPAPLLIELDAVQERLKRLLEAEQREPEEKEKRRYKAAIKAHRDKIEELERVINEKRTQL